MDHCHICLQSATEMALPSGLTLKTDPSLLNGQVVTADERKLPSAAHQPFLYILSSKCYLNLS